MMIIQKEEYETARPYQNSWSPFKATMRLSLLFEVAPLTPATSTRLIPKGDTLQRWRTEPYIMITGSGSF
uniref:Uncharacterized protein n=1 Tax=Brassica campestris TaxID=3711 RepID=A0A3P5YJW6_BRACM|nr:unnamed protein product [Brassica rapa]